MLSVNSTRANALGPDATYMSSYTGLPSPIANVRIQPGKLIRWYCFSVGPSLSNTGIFRSNTYVPNSFEKIWNNTRPFSVGALGSARNHAEIRIQLPQDHQFIGLAICPKLRSLPAICAYPWPVYVGTVRSLELPWTSSSISQRNFQELSVEKPPAMLASFPGNGNPGGIATQYDKKTDWIGASNILEIRLSPSPIESQVIMLKLPEWAKLSYNGADRLVSVQLPKWAWSSETGTPTVAPTCSKSSNTCIDGGGPKPLPANTITPSWV